MQSEAATIADYIASLAPDKRAVIAHLDEMIRAIFPQAESTMRYKMPTYLIGPQSLSINSQKNYFSIYVDPPIVEKFRNELCGLSIGKCCIRFRTAKQLPDELIRKIIAAHG